MNGLLSLSTVMASIFNPMLLNVQLKNIASEPSAFIFDPVSWASLISYIEDLLSAQGVVGVASYQAIIRCNTTMIYHHQ
jgi:hypothetical protein